MLTHFYTLKVFMLYCLEYYVFSSQIFFIFDHLYLFRGLFVSLKKHL